VFNPSSPLPVLLQHGAGGLSDQRRWWGPWARGILLKDNPGAGVARNVLYGDVMLPLLVTALAIVAGISTASTR